MSNNRWIGYKIRIVPCYGQNLHNYIAATIYLSCIYFAGSVEQNQPAHTCSLILLCTFRSFLLMNFYQGNLYPIPYYHSKPVCVKVDNRNLGVYGFMQFTSRSPKEIHIYVHFTCLNIYKKNPEF